MNPLLQRAKNSVDTNFNIEIEEGFWSKERLDHLEEYFDEVAELYSKYRVEEETEKVKKLKKLAQDLYSVTGNNKPPLSVFAVLQEYNKIMKEV